MHNHIPITDQKTDKDGDNPFCAICGEDLFPNYEWFIWETAEQVEARQRYTGEFLEQCREAKDV